MTIAVFKTVDRRLSAAMVGSTPTRFRHFSNCLPIVPHIEILDIKQNTKPRCWLNLLEPRLVQSHTAVIILFDYRVVFVGLLNRAEFPSRLSEVAQTLDAISGTQFLVGGGGFGERRLPGTVCIRGCAGV